MAKQRKNKDSLVKSSDIKLKSSSDKAAPKASKVENLNPNTPNKSRLTDNIKSRSAKSVTGGSLGKTQSLPLSLKRSDGVKKKK